MLNTLSAIIGVLALLLAALSFLPLLGWGNWLVIPLAIVGAALGFFAERTGGRNINLLVILVGVIRLMLGGGIV